MILCTYCDYDCLTLYTVYRLNIILTELNLDGIYKNYMKIILLLLQY